METATRQPGPTDKSTVGEGLQVVIEEVDCTLENLDWRGGTERDHGGRDDGVGEMVGEMRPICERTGVTLLWMCRRVTSRWAD